MCGNFSTETFDGPTRTNSLAALAAIFRWSKLPVTGKTLRFHYEDSAAYGYPHGTLHTDCPCHPGGRVNKIDLIAAIAALVKEKPQ